MNHKLFLLLAAAGLLSCTGEPDTLSLWQVHSLRGNILPSTLDGQKAGGLSLISGAFKSSVSPEALNVRAGVYNMYYGSPEAYFSEGSAVIDLMNQAKFDLLLVGVREFYFGPQAFRELAVRAEFPFVSTNLRNRGGGKLDHVAARWLSPEGKWAVLNLTPVTILTQNLKAHVEDISLKDDLASLDDVQEEFLASGRKPRSVVFAGGYSYSPETEPSAELRRLLDHPLAQTVVLGAVPPGTEGVYVLANSRGESRTVVSQNSSRLMNGLVLENLLIPRDKIPAASSLPLTETSVSPDPELGSALSDIRRNLEKVMTEPVTRIESAMTHSFEQESEVGNLLADLFRASLGTEVFLLNSGTLRSDLSEGVLDKQGLYRLLPFGGNLAKTTLRGKDLLAVLKRSFSFIGHPEKGRGFLQISGMKVLWNPNSPPDFGLKPGSVLVNGLPLDPDKTYTVGSTAYLLSGGDGYAELAAGTTPAAMDPLPILTLTIQEFKKAASVTSPGKGRYVTP